MDVKGLVWLGTRTDRYAEMKSFCIEVLGLDLAHEEPETAVFDLPDGSSFEIFGPASIGGGHPPRGVVGGFHVGDLRAARSELEGAGCEIVHVVPEHGAYAWLYFRAPDGNLYELTSGPY